MSTVNKSFVKDPDSIDLITFDWSEWLDEGETIDNATVTVDNPLVKESAVTWSTDSTGTVSVRISGGVDEEIYDAVCEVTTTASRVEDFIAKVRCQED